MALNRTAHGKHWYSRFRVAGKRIQVRLETEVQGAPGSAEFRASMAEAKREEGVLLRRANRGDAEFHRKMAEAMGPDLDAVGKRDLLLDDLAEKWGKTQKPGAMGSRWRQMCKARLGLFSAWARKQGALTAAQVGRPLAQGYMDHLKGTGVAPATVNATLSLLQRVFRALGPAAGVKVNPFEHLDRMPGRSVNRVPLTQDELGRLLKACPPEIAGAVATAACTGMRRGDACRLERTKVDLKAGMLTRVRIRKTGAIVDIPILPMLRQYLEPAMGEGKGIQDSGFRIQHGGRGKYVWPEAARLARENPNGLNWRMNVALAAAKLSHADDRRGAGVRAANIRGWHSLKTTFVTEALNHGFPIELLRKVVGNSAVDVVRDHYYQPDAEKIKVEFQKAMGEWGK